MTLIELDLLVKYLYENREIARLSDIHDGFSKVSKMPAFDVLIMLNKLERDNIVNRRKATIKETKGDVITVKDMPVFNISFDGIDFFEQAKGEFKGKPYQYEKNKKKIKERAEKIENFPKDIGG